jgi:hypothetical protein
LGRQSIPLEDHKLPDKSNKKFRLRATLLSERRGLVPDSKAMLADSAEGNHAFQ